MSTASEQAVERFLLLRGWQLLHQNYRCPAGEIDLIFQHQQEIIFIEVKYRARPDFGDPATHLSSQQLHRIQRAALHYLNDQAALEHLQLRFDFIAAEPAQGAIARKQLIAFEAYWFDWLEYCV